MQSDYLKPRSKLFFFRIMRLGIDAASKPFNKRTKLLLGGD
jgi:hypothetical protein